MGVSILFPSIFCYVTSSISNENTQFISVFCHSLSIMLQELIFHTYVDHLVTFYSALVLFKVKAVVSLILFNFLFPIIILTSIHTFLLVTKVFSFHLLLFDKHLFTFYRWRRAYRNIHRHHSFFWSCSKWYNSPSLYHYLSLSPLKNGNMY